MGPPALLRYLVTGAVFAAAGLAGAIPFLVWDSNRAPEFYGAFTAAIVAAIAVILGTHYQAELTRKRDVLLRKQDETAEAIDLCFWLEHAANEVGFIIAVLKRLRDHLAANDATHVGLPTSQFREIISARFFDELLPRAKAAARLPVDIAGPVTRTIYHTFHVADRIQMMRGISDFQSSSENIDEYLIVLTGEANKLREASAIVEVHLAEVGAMSAVIRN